VTVKNRFSKNILPILGRSGDDFLKVLGDSHHSKGKLANFFFFHHVNTMEGLPLEIAPFVTSIIWGTDSNGFFLSNHREHS
jgi:hypothetical protein